MKKTLSTLILAAATALAGWSAPSILTLKNTITDDAIVYPESFETDTHKMMQNWYLQNYTDLDHEADSRPLVNVSDEVYIQRLSQMPTTIEMPFNQVVKSYIEMYTQRKRGLVENMLGMSLYYMPIFEQALEKEGLPLELKYLPVIESALNPDAVSRAGATGLWQFMLPTARGLSLEINSIVDERRDPVRSSEAAAKYLKQLYNIYNDWSLAIAAYNCGPGNVNKALRRAGGDQKDFWAIYPLLPAETRGYVPCFIAANYAMTYYAEHNISPALAKRPIITDSIHVDKRVHFNQISDVLNIPVEELRVLNPQFRQDVIPGDSRPYALVLPSRQVYCYIMSEDSILAHNANLYARRTVAEPATLADLRGENISGDYITKEQVKYHKVRKGETLASIAKRYGVSTKSIKSTNRCGNKVKRGQTLKIVTYYRVPVPKKEEPSKELAGNAAEGSGNSQEGMTQEGVELAEAAEGSGQSQVGLAQNGDETATAEVAQEVKTETKQSTTQARRATQKAQTKKKDRAVHVTVKKGETLTKIAKRNGTTVAQLQKLNNIKGSNIQPGQKLRVK
ncbi:MAG: transglycosylase SLT domain-containing protein [Bacteroidales bacterium]|nr:transglycosylase SLT domain-containing protein [Bacteroidales bacterium]MCD8395365.1 transglycosylase SLT domain-containing protein [Bacteroidales bacterium]